MLYRWDCFEMFKKSNDFIDNSLVGSLAGFVISFFCIFVNGEKPTKWWACVKLTFQTGLGREVSQWFVLKICHLCLNKCDPTANCMFTLPVEDFEHLKMVTRCVSGRLGMVPFTSCKDEKQRQEAPEGSLMSWHRTSLWWWSNSKLVNATPNRSYKLP